MIHVKFFIDSGLCNWFFLTHLTLTTGYTVILSKLANAQYFTLEKIVISTKKIQNSFSHYGQYNRKPTFFMSSSLTQRFPDNLSKLEHLLLNNVTAFENVFFSNDLATRWILHFGKNPLRRTLLCTLWCPANVDKLEFTKNLPHQEYSRCHLQNSHWMTTRFSLARSESYCV